jgi:hypothetical protein
MFYLWLGLYSSKKETKLTKHLEVPEEVSPGSVEGTGHTQKKS